MPSRTGKPRVYGIGPAPRRYAVKIPGVLHKLLHSADNPVYSRGGRDAWKLGDVGMPVAVAVAANPGA